MTRLVWIIVRGTIVIQGTVWLAQLSLLSLAVALSLLLNRYFHLEQVGSIVLFAGIWRSLVGLKVEQHLYPEDGWNSDAYWRRLDRVMREIHQYGECGSIHEDTHCSRIVMVAIEAMDITGILRWRHVTTSVRIAHLLMDRIDSNVAWAQVVRTDLDMGWEPVLRVSPTDTLGDLVMQNRGAAIELVDEMNKPELREDLQEIDRVQFRGQAPAAPKPRGDA